MPEKIVIKSLGLTYQGSDSKQDFTALEDVDLTINEGEFVCIIGSSGCGKSTLLSVLQGIILPTSGEVIIDGTRLSGPGPERAVVLQHYSLFPWMSALKNVVFGIKQVSRGKKSQSEMETIATGYLTKVGLDNFMHKLPGELSGGMQQRVAIARALAVDADILLMDEPFGAIDARNRLILQELLLELWMSEEMKRTVVFVTHDIDEALLLSDRIVFMEPKHIVNEIKVDYPRPREKEVFYASDSYRDLRAKLLKLFYDDVGNRIGGEEVIL
jgi:NitT/TauT family transport system ATP-binding protein